MQYRGKSIEIIGKRQMFDKTFCWIHILENDEFKQVMINEIEDYHSNLDALSYARYVSIAARIQGEIAQKRLLAPYESSLTPLPHQILVLEKVMQGLQTRYLLADEVGMGKTIEAGLVLKEKKLRGEVKRVLLIVPKSAMLQWQSELREHFCENFHIYDSSFINSMAKTFASFDAEDELNFWKQHNQIIVSSDALKPLTVRDGWSQKRVDEYNKYRLEAVLEADFDMVIIDEAHKMGGATAQVSRYVMADALCNSVPNVLLLSATPHRGKSDHFRRVLQLIDPETFTGDGMPSIEEIQPYVMRSEKRFALDYDGKKLFQQRETQRLNVQTDKWEFAKQHQLYEDVTEYVRKSFENALDMNSYAKGLVMVMFQKLASSSTAAVLSAMRNRYKRLLEGEDPDELEEYGEQDSLRYSDFEEEGLMAAEMDVVYNAGIAFNEIDELGKLIKKAEEVMRIEKDAKMVALLDRIYQLRSDPSEENLKVLVFTEFRGTQEYLIESLKDAGLDCVGINGSMSLTARKNALQRFKDDVPVMVATDAAGESLNMQFCHIVINYDLPWNPMALEQRIGRIDRIGQSHKVVAINMLTDNSVDNRIYNTIMSKLDTIMDELGIDKTSDVLDSTIEMKHLNQLYLQSLLDPRQFEKDSKKWLDEIKDKLRNYRSTEHALPSISEKEITKTAASEVKYSPLPIWLEDLMDLHCINVKGFYDKMLNGLTLYHLPDGNLGAIFDSKWEEDNPAAIHITLQHPIIQHIIRDIDGGIGREIPVIQSLSGEERPGYLTIWKVTGKNDNETKVCYTAQYISENGRVFAPYGQTLWDMLVKRKAQFKGIGFIASDPTITENAQLQKNLYSVFLNIESEIQSDIESKLDKKRHVMDVAENRIRRIGIENIRQGKLKKLQEQRDQFENNLSHAYNVVPDVKHILTVRING